jgi:S1-C subfamily serine protease
MRRLRRKTLIFLYVVVIALASFWGLQASRSHPQASPPALPNNRIAARVDPALVDIVTALGYQHAAAAGTGLVLTRSGEVLTNNHVIEGATAIKVIDIGNGRTYRASVVGYDRSHDVAVLRLHGASGLRTVVTADSARARVGEKVVAIGNAGGRGGTPSVVSGHIVSLGASVTASDASAGVTERLSGMIGHNAAIKPGDSGGPLVNGAGKVIGINTAASSGYKLHGGTQAFAIPINHALSIARQIEARRGSVTVHIGATGFLGVAVMSAQQASTQGRPAGHGAVIAGVFPGSPANRAGIRAGDVIVSAGRRHVWSPLALQSILGRHHPGDRVSISWIDQSSHRYSATVTLIKGPAG